jgi:hypothetical protein
MKPTSFSDTTPIPKKYEQPVGEYIDDILESQDWSREMGQQQVIRGGEKDVNRKVNFE